MTERVRELMEELTLNAIQVDELDDGGAMIFLDVNDCKELVGYIRELERKTRGA